MTSLANSFCLQKCFSISWLMLANDGIDAKTQFLLYVHTYTYLALTSTMLPVGALLPRRPVVSYHHRASPFAWSLCQNYYVSFGIFKWFMARGIGHRPCGPACSWLCFLSKMLTSKLKLKLKLKSKSASALASMTSCPWPTLRRTFHMRDLNFWGR